MASHEETLESTKRRSSAERVQLADALLAESCALACGATATKPYHELDYSPFMLTLLPTCINMTVLGHTSRQTD